MDRTEFLRLIRQTIRESLNESINDTKQVFYYTVARCTGGGLNGYETTVIEGPRKKQATDINAVATFVAKKYDTPANRRVFKSGFVTDYIFIACLNPDNNKIVPVEIHKDGPVILMDHICSNKEKEQLFPKVNIREYNHDIVIKPRSKYMVRYITKDDDTDKVWVTADNKQDAVNTVRQDYWDVKKIISVIKI